MTTPVSTARSLRLGLLTVAVASVIVLAFLPRVDAGVFTINACQADRAGYATAAFDDRAPVTAAHYRLCGAGGRRCEAGIGQGVGIEPIRDLMVPSAGEWEVRLWRQDAAGNQQPANASLPVTLRFDPEPPEVSFQPLSASDPDPGCGAGGRPGLRGYRGPDRDRADRHRHLAGAAYNT